MTARPTVYALSPLALQSQVVTSQGQTDVPPEFASYKPPSSPPLLKRHFQGPGFYSPSLMPIPNSPAVS